MNDDMSMESAMGPKPPPIDARFKNLHYLYSLLEYFEDQDNYMTPGGAMYVRLFTQDMSHTDAMYCLDRTGYRTRLVFEVKDYVDAVAKVLALKEARTMQCGDKWTAFVTSTTHLDENDTKLVFAFRNEADALMTKMEFPH